MVKGSKLMRASPSFHILIKQVQHECLKIGKKPLTAEQITNKIAKKITAQEILYNNYIRF